MGEELEKGTFVEMTGDMGDLSCTASSPEISRRYCWEGSEVTPPPPRFLKCKVRRDHLQAVMDLSCPLWCSAMDLSSRD